MKRKSSAEENVDFLRRHIDRARELATRCDDPEVAKSLINIATESQRVLDGLIRKTKAE
jgi:hypothetical protein